MRILALYNHHDLPDAALSGASEQRGLISRMKAEADALRASLYVHKNRFDGNCPAAQ
jgi:hypothetical protein